MDKKHHIAKLFIAICNDSASAIRALYENDYHALEIILGIIFNYVAQLRAEVKELQRDGK